MHLACSLLLLEPNHAADSGPAVLRMKLQPVQPASWMSQAVWWLLVQLVASLAPPHKLEPSVLTNTTAAVAAVAVAAAAAAAATAEAAPTKATR